MNLKLFKVNRKDGISSSQTMPEPAPEPITLLVTDDQLAEVSRLTRSSLACETQWHLNSALIIQWSDLLEGKFANLNSLTGS